MNDRAPCKVKGSHIADEAAHAPYHMAHGIIYQSAPEKDKNTVGRETGSFHNTAADDGWREDGKSHLEQGEEDMGNGFRIIRIGCHAYIMEKGPVQIADDAAHIRAEGKRIPIDKPLYGKDSQTYHGHHNSINGVLTTYQTTVEKSQSRSHNEHQQCGNGHVSHVCSIQLTSFISRHGHSWKETGSQKCR